MNDKNENSNNVEMPGIFKSMLSIIEALNTLKDNWESNALNISSMCKIIARHSIISGVDDIGKILIVDILELVSEAYTGVLNKINHDDIDETTAKRVAKKLRARIKEKANVYLPGFKGEPLIQFLISNMHSVLSNAFLSMTECIYIAYKNIIAVNAKWNKLVTETPNSIVDKLSINNINEMVDTLNDIWKELVDNILNTFTEPLSKRRIIRIKRIKHMMNHLIDEGLDANDAFKTLIHSLMLKQGRTRFDVWVLSKNTINMDVIKLLEFNMEDM